jgi:hypothetical protein
MRRLLTILGCAAAGVVLADTIAWQIATWRMRASLQTVLSDMRASGWTVRCSPPGTGGWPFAASLSLTDVHVEGGSSALPGGIVWQGGRLVVSVALFHPWHLTIAPEGEEMLRISHLPAVAFAAGRMRATVPLGHGRIDQATLDASGIAGGLRSSYRRQDVRIGRLFVAVHARVGHPGVDASLDFTASDVGLPDTGRWPLGANVNSFAAAALLHSPLLSGSDSREQAQSWHDGGGKLDVSTLDLHWGPMSLQGDATLGLDARLQPAGGGHAQVLGYADALDALAAGGVIGPGMAVTYKAILGLMARGPASAISVPLTLRDSTLSLGQIPLARFNDVAWR